MSKTASGLVMGVAAVLASGIAFAAWSLFRPADRQGVATAQPAAGAWALPGKPAVRGAASVTVSSARIRPVEYRMMGQTSKSKVAYLVIELTIASADDGKKIDYATWGGSSTFSRFPNIGTLKDELGNVYKPAPYDARMGLVGRADRQSVYPGKPVSDILAFEVPIEAAKLVRLELPERNVSIEGDGSFQFEIPRAFWSAPDPAPATRRVGGW